MAKRRMRTRSSTSRHADWLGLLDVSGPFVALPVLDRAFPQGLPVPDSHDVARLRLAAEEWRAATPGRGRDSTAVAWPRYVLRGWLGMPAEVLRGVDAPVEGLEVTIAEHGVVLRPDYAVVEPEGRPGAGEPRLLVSVAERGQSLERPASGDGWSASPTSRMVELLRGLRSRGVRLGLATNGEDWTLVHVPAEGSTLEPTFATWHAWLWFDEPSTLHAFRALLAPERFFGVAATDTLEALFAESEQHAREVTERLGLQVRHAVEVLVQAVDRLDRDTGRTLLAGFGERQLYEAAVTVMMRLVFLLYAEERELLPTANAVWEDCYSPATLLDQLRESADQAGEEVLERRHAAWARLLATFRAVHGGCRHDKLQLPAYGGGLFDPDRFPFLEGRRAGTRWREVLAAPLLIDDRAVLHVLEALQYLRFSGQDVRRLSFRELGVEQIGHVYESLLDHAAVRAPDLVLGLAGTTDREPEVSVSDLEAWREGGASRLVERIAEATGRSANAVQSGLRFELPADDGRWLMACENDAATYQRARPWAGLVRDDSFGVPVVVKSGGLYVTKGSDRRSTGTHYTPPDITEQVVQHALEPLVYYGPAEGKPRADWKLRSPAELLRLTVCDPAMGSGAFLVQACRYLAERLLEAWGALEAANPGKVLVSPEGKLSEGAPSEALLPRDPAERLAAARRYVVDRCLFGVDRDPMAVEMAKLSLWLVTLHPRLPFTFLDHALRCGDSLLGLTESEQLAEFELDGGGDGLQVTIMKDLVGAPLGQARAKRTELASFPVLGPKDAEAKARLLADADALLGDLHSIADALSAWELWAPSQAKRDAQREFKNLEELAWAALDDFAAAEHRQRSRQDLATRARAMLQAGRPPGGKDRVPLHWILAFPDVFAGDRGQRGFACVVGNPPFQGGQKITGEQGTDYREYLVARLAGGKKGSADLCAYFLLRACALVRPGGQVGLIGTDTLVQGATREVGIDQALQRGFALRRAVTPRPWPGEAAVRFVRVWLTKGEWRGEHVLDDQVVSGITSYLTPAGAVVGEPHRLAANAKKSFQGAIILGMGFTMSPEEAAERIARDERCRAVLFPYLNGDDLNSSPTQEASRWVINFWDWPLDRSAAGSWGRSGKNERKALLRDGRVPRDYPDPAAADYPELLEIVREKVKPQRDGDKMKQRREKWWQYGARAPGLAKAIVGLDRVLAICRHTEHMGFSFAATRQVFSEALNVFAIDTSGTFASLQSTVHECWARRYSGGLKRWMRYSTTGAFETFPFPENHPGLESVGATYDAHRRATMLAREEGLCDIYNAFHDPACRDAEILKLRDLHSALDAAVLKAYGWESLDLEMVFRETDRGIRWVPSARAATEILERLLKLNHERHAEERAAGIVTDEAEEDDDGE